MPDITNKHNAINDIIATLRFIIIKYDQINKQIIIDIVINNA